MSWFLSLFQAGEVNHYAPFFIFVVVPGAGCLLGHLTWKAKYGPYYPYTRAEAARGCRPAFWSADDEKAAKGR